MGGRQLDFSEDDLDTVKNQSKRETFLAEMQAVVPWQALISLIEPHYPRQETRVDALPPRRPLLLRIHLQQQLLCLNDPAMEQALIAIRLVPG